MVALDISAPEKKVVDTRETKSEHGSAYITAQYILGRIAGAAARTASFDGDRT